MFTQFIGTFHRLRRKSLLAAGVFAISLLVTQSALAAVPDADWCPNGINCVTYDTLQQAVNAAKLAGVPGDINADAGIFAESVTVDGLKDVTFTGGPSTITGSVTMTNSKNIVFMSFTVQGASGIAVDHASGKLRFSSCTGGISITNSTLKSATSSGLQITNHNGVVALNKVTASSNFVTGATIDNRAGSAGVSVLKSKFDKNLSFGLKILSDGGVYLSGVSASKNGDDGVNINNSTGTLGISVDTPSSGKNIFDKNAGTGLYALSKGEIQLHATLARGNTEFGATLVNDTGTQNIIVGDPATTSTFDSNGQAGLFVQTAGGAGLRRVSASKNLSWGMTVLASNTIMATDLTVVKNGTNGGAILLNYTGSGNVIVQTDKLKLNRFDSNKGVAGLNVLTSGDVALIDISASKNVDARGVHISAVGQVHIDVKKSKLSHFDGNTKEGLVIETSGTSVIINNSTASKNGAGSVFDGIQIDTTSGNGSVSLSCSTASKNTEDGIEAMMGTGQLFLYGVTTAANGGLNINSSDLFPTVSVCP